MPTAIENEQCGAVHGRASDWRVLIVGVITIIVVAHLFSLLRLTPPGLIENRVLAGVPKLPTSIAQWEALPKQLDSYVDDNFPPRAHMIAGLNYLRYKLGYSGSPKIIVGRNGWLFYDDGNHLGIASGRLRLDAAGVQAWVLGLKQRVDYLNRRGIKLYASIGPVKEDIYPENRPRWLSSSRGRNDADDLFQAAHLAGLTQVVDPRPAFLEEKSRQVLYDGFDTHWTALGAYLGYRALLSRMSEDFPDLAPLPFSAFDDLPRPNPNNLPRDLSLMLGIANMVPHDRVSLIALPIHDPKRTDFLSERHDWTAPQVLHTDAPGGRTMLLLHDSFTSEMLPMLKRQFTTIILAHLQDGLWRPDLIERFHPDMVVMNIIEPGFRFLMNPIPGMDSQ